MELPMADANYGESWPRKTKQRTKDSLKQAEARQSEREESADDDALDAVTDIAEARSKIRNLADAVINRDHVIDQLKMPAKPCLQNLTDAIFRLYDLALAEVWEALARLLAHLSGYWPISEASWVQSADPEFPHLAARAPSQEPRQEPQEPLVEGTQVAGLEAAHRDRLRYHAEA
jgi:hypothetical protein